MLGRFYRWFWYNTEFRLTPEGRRPYTFIFRDWIYTHPGLTQLLVFLFIAGMIVLSQWHGTTSTVLGMVGCFVLAHLVWGSPWILGQQEFPEYKEED